MKTRTIADIDALDSAWEKQWERQKARAIQHAQEALWEQEILNISMRDIHWPFQPPSKRTGAHEIKEALDQE